MSNRHASGRRLQPLTLGIGAALLALTGVQSAAIPALAADPPQVIELSSDGSSYARSMSELFGAVTLVPLTSANTDFWVRNTGDTPAYLTVLSTDTRVSDADLAGALTLSAGVTADGVAFPLPPVGSCRTLEAGSLLAPGQDARIAAQLAMGNLDGTRGQGGHIDFKLRVMLSDLPLTSVGDTACPAMAGEEIGGGGASGNGSDGSSSGSASGGSGSSGTLETTGAELRTALTWGVVLAALGFIIVAFKRRRRRHSPMDPLATSGPLNRG